MGKLILRGDEYEPGDKDWEAAMYVFRTSCMIQGIFFPHTVHCHFLDGGFAATVSRQMDADHPFRRFLAPFTIGTINVNFGALEVIAARHGILWRESALCQKGCDEFIRL